MIGRGLGWVTLSAPLLLPPMPATPPASPAPMPSPPAVQVASGRPWSLRMADSVLWRDPDPLSVDAEGRPLYWNYTQGLVFTALLAADEGTADRRYVDYVKRYYDAAVAADGTIGGGYRLDAFNVDHVNPGKALLRLHRRAPTPRTKAALDTLRRQLREHPRTSEGGFWHKQIYPHQMWLDGLYMGAAFLAEYAREFGEAPAFDDVARQFVLMERHARDEKTGLLYHGWDESRQQRWCDPATGRSRQFWGRAMGWYAMGLVDTLDAFPADHPRRAELVAILRRLADAVVRVQDQDTGVWWQVLDQPGRAGNYRESSASSMFVYALAKGARLGALDASHLKAARAGYEGLLREFIRVDAQGVVSIERACAVAGLGGNPYRDGSYEYYVGERVRANDPKAVGPFILASLELERAAR